MFLFHTSCWKQNKNHGLLKLFLSWLFLWIYKFMYRYLTLCWVFLKVESKDHLKNNPEKSLLKTYIPGVQHLSFTHTEWEFSEWESLHFNKLPWLYLCTLHFENHKCRDGVGRCYSHVPANINNEIIYVFFATWRKLEWAP